jgi:putative tricarboxylic transport membrane protein
MKIGSVAFAAAILAIGVVYETMGRKMPRGNLAYPGPGLFPTIIGVFLIATALACVIQELVSRKKTPERAAAIVPPDELSAPAVRHVAKTFQLMALLVAYTFVLKPLGFPLAIAAFVTVAIRIFGYRKLLPTLAMAGIIAVVSYVSFVVWLKVPLPVGVLEPLLGY